MDEPFFGASDEPLSPVLTPFRPQWEPSEPVLLGENDSDVDEDLEADAPWRPALQNEHNRRFPRSSNTPSTVTSTWKSSRKDHLLLSLMNGGRISNAVENQALLGGLSEEYGSTEQSPATQRPRRQRRRFLLPLRIRGQVISTCPDSGSDANIMSLTTAQQLGLVWQALPMQQRFSLANGVEVQSLGQITTDYSFTSSNTHQPAECVFHVFSALAVPVIMGMEFVSATQVFTTRRSELIIEEMALTESLSVNFLGSPRNSLLCRLQTHVACAIVDTGSDLNLVGSDFAQKLADLVTPNHEKLQLADGSFDYTAGLITIDFSIGDVDEKYRFLARSGEERLDFHILESLTTDVLIGLDTLEDFAVFQNHTASFIPTAPYNALGNTNVLRHVGTVEKWVVEQCRKLGKGFARGPNTASEILENLDVRRQRENALQERDDWHSSRMLTPFAQDRSYIPSSDLQFENDRPTSESGLPVLYFPESPERELERAPWPIPGPWWTGEEVPSNSRNWKCSSSGCEAAPFETHDLLASHMDSHYLPHFCPVIGCPRAEGGKPFRRKNEMIRHGLVHDSPGYMCPFCPNREHKYPRPDNLARHVRVHHVDKSKDDPVLIEVLSRRPDGPYRGRRRGSRMNRIG